MPAIVRCVCVAVVCREGTLELPIAIAHRDCHLRLLVAIAGRDDPLRQAPTTPRFANQD